MILNELFGGNTPKQAERKLRSKNPPKVNPAKLASDFRKVRAMGDNESHAQRIFRDLVAAVGEDKATQLIQSQDSIKKDSDKPTTDVWKGRA